MYPDGTVRVIIGTSAEREQVTGVDVHVQEIQLPLKEIQSLNGHVADCVFMDTGELIDGLEELIALARNIQRTYRTIPSPSATDGPRYHVK